MGLFNGVINTVRFKMGVIVFDQNDHSSCFKVWRRCLNAERRRPKVAARLRFLI